MHTAIKVVKQARDQALKARSWVSALHDVEDFDQEAVDAAADALAAFLEECGAYLEAET